MEDEFYYGYIVSNGMVHTKKLLKNSIESYYKKESKPTTDNRNIETNIGE
jgi:hypothetical protein